MKLFKPFTLFILFGGDEAWPLPKGEALLEGAESGAVHRQHRGAAEAFVELQRHGRVPLLADVRISLVSLGFKYFKTKQHKASYRHVGEKDEENLHVQICAKTFAQSMDMSMFALHMDTCMCGMSESALCTALACQIVAHFCERN